MMFENIESESERLTIKVILDAITDTSTMISGMEASFFEKPYLCSLTEGERYTIIMGITGQFEGNIMFSFGDGFIKMIASVMNGMEVTEVDELAESSVIEFANMISGSATIKLVDFYDSEKINMAPPVFIKGSDVSVSGKIKDVYGYTFKINSEELDVGIAIKGIKA